MCLHGENDMFCTHYEVLIDVRVFKVIIMALYWMLELLPLAVTSVLPVAMAPMLGILGTGEVSMIYMKGSNMFFVGGELTTIPLMNLLFAKTTTVNGSVAFFHS